MARIVSDSSADMLKFEGVDFKSVPMSISTSERTFTDDEILDTLKNIDTDTLTPLEALTMLHKLVQQARHDM